jgi:hypothetical protein
VFLAGVETTATPEGKVVLSVRVPPARTTIHSVQGRFLQRQGSRNVALSTSAIRQLLASRGGLGPLPASTGGAKTPSTHAQMYEILRYQVTLTLLDVEGKQAILERREKVRFLQDNVIALYDHAWGDGQLFVGYRVTPGRVADRFRVGSRYQTLISLRDTKHRGDVLSYRVRRRIVGGFPGEEEWLEAEVDHPTHYLEMAVIFPKGRPCQGASVVEVSTNHRTGLSLSSVKRRRDGREILTWTTRKPPVGERYAIHWRW